MVFHPVGAVVFLGSDVEAAPVDSFAATDT
jgi:hypothetical protein